MQTAFGLLWTEATRADQAEQVAVGHLNRDENHVTCTFIPSIYSISAIVYIQLMLPTFGRSGEGQVVLL